jgi:hypothetical protein
MMTSLKAKRIWRSVTSMPYGIDFSPYAKAVLTAITPHSLCLRRRELALYPRTEKNSNC